MEVKKPRKICSKTKKIKFRVGECQKLMIKQNYRDHLQDKHPEEDSKNLRAYGEKHIANFFSLGSRARQGLDSSSGLAEGASSRKGLERMEMQDANEMEA